MREDLPLSGYGTTHVGRVRDGNEDAYHCGQRLFVVADGLGGHAAGEVASRLAVEVLSRYDPSSHAAMQEAQDALTAAVQEANRVVHADAEATPARAGMATTLTAAAVHDGQLLLAHVGDSRAYLHRDGGLRQLTTDHTAAQEAVTAGQLTTDEAARHPARHALSRAVGLDSDVAVDVPPPVPLGPGDRFLLCSDGLTEVLDDGAIATILGTHPDVRDAGEALVEAALQGGGPDNVTVVVVAVGG